MQCKQIGISPISWNWNCWYMAGKEKERESEHILSHSGILLEHFFFPTCCKSNSTLALSTTGKER